MVVVVGGVVGGDVGDGGVVGVGDVGRLGAVVGGGDAGVLGADVGGDFIPRVGDVGVTTGVGARGESGAVASFPVTTTVHFPHTSVIFPLTRPMEVSSTNR